MALVKRGDNRVVREMRDALRARGGWSYVTPDGRVLCDAADMTDDEVRIVWISNDWSIK